MGDQATNMLRQVVDNVKDTLLPHPNPKTFSYLRNQPFSKRAFALLQDLFPILPSLHNYNAQKFKCDFMAGLTLAIFAIPQVHLFYFSSHASLVPRFLKKSL